MFCIYLAISSLFLGKSPLQWAQIPDEREWLTREYLPRCSGRMLYIGVGSYTTRYPYYPKTPSLFETIDYLEERAPFGSPFKHYVSDILCFEPDSLYEHVSFFGILGYPAKKYAPFVEKEEIEQVLKKIDSLIQIGGTLQIGANYYEQGRYSVEFWEQTLESQFAEKYATITIGISPLSVIWLGRKVSK